MPCQLPADCLNEIFENLEDDKQTLRSCLLVNRLWCELSVRILWRNIWNYGCPDNLYTLISCLPNKSKELLRKNEIFISTPTSNPSLFNYAAFCKVLSINEICRIINRNKPSNTSRLIIAISAGGDSDSTNLKKTMQREKNHTPVRPLLR